jgi:hypothetical protein
VANTKDKQANPPHRNGGGKSIEAWIETPKGRRNKYKFDPKRTIYRQSISTQQPSQVEGRPTSPLVRLLSRRAVNNSQGLVRNRTEANITYS